MSSGNFQKAFLNNFTIFITLKENKIILHHGKLFMMAMPTNLHLASKAKRSHYYLFHQEKLMRTNCK